MKIGNLVFAAGVVLSVPFMALGATKGSCESAAVSVSTGKTYDIKLVNEYEDGEYDEDSGVYYAAIKLSRGQSYTIWIDNFDSEQVDGFQVEPRETTKDEDEKDIYGPSAYFDYDDYSGIEAAYLYSDEWDTEEDPKSWLYYIAIDGEVGATATLHVSTGIQSPVATGSEDKPKEITPSATPTAMEAKFVDGEYYFEATCKAGTCIFTTTKGTAEAPVTLTFDSYPSGCTVEDVSAKVATEGNVAYLVTATSAATVDFHVAGSDSTFGLTYQYASAGTMGKVTVNIKGTDKATWSIKDASGSYASGTTIGILGTQTIVFSKVTGFSTPNNRTVTPTAEQSELEVTGVYNDTYDPKDDVATGATKLSITAKTATAARTLFAEDSADFFSFTAKDGYYYNFELTSLEGDALLTVAKKATPTTPLVDPAAKISALPLAKGDYVVKVAHGETGVDASYALAYSSANIGAISFAKTAVTAKKSAGSVTLTINRSAAEGKVRVLYGTVNGTAQPGVDYYAQQGELVWENGDKKAKTITIRLIPEAFATNAISRKFSVQLKAIDEEELEEDEYKAAFASGKDEAVITVTEAKSKAPTAVKTATVKTEDVPLETGTYQGVIAENGMTLTNGFPALASVTFTAKNATKKALSAKVLLGGKTYSFAADTWDAELSDDDTAVAVMTLKQKVNKVDYENTLRIEVAKGATATEGDWATAVAAVELTMNVPDANNKGVQEEIVYAGELYRDNSKIQDYLTAVVSGVGYYTVALSPSGVMPGEGIPAGNGYLTLTLDNKGKAKIAGMLADGSTKPSYTSIVAVKDDGDTLLIPVFVAKSPYCFGGTLKLVRGEDGKYVVDSSESLIWNNDNALLTYDGEEGWKITLDPVGGYFNTVDNLQAHYLTHDLSVSTVETIDLLEEALTSGYEYVTDAQPNELKVLLTSNTLSTDKKSLVKDGKLVDFEESVNPCNVQVKLTRATGLVTGSFSVWTQNEAGTAQKEISNLKHYGVLLLSRDDTAPIDSDILTAGFFTQTATLKYEVQSGTKTVTKTRKYTASNPFNILAVDQGEPYWYADDWGDRPEE